jgi:hypothetical protein
VEQQQLRAALEVASAGMEPNRFCRRSVKPGFYEKETYWHLTWRSGLSSDWPVNDTVPVMVPVMIGGDIYTGIHSYFSRKNERCCYQAGNEIRIINYAPYPAEVEYKPWY